MFVFAAWLFSGALAAGHTPPNRLADIGPAPPIVLTDSAAKPFDMANLRGKVGLVSFVYTTCNGTCPATTQALKRTQNALQQAELWGKSVEFVSITLDPERDTPEALARYARLYGADMVSWHFLTGSPARVESVIKAWGIWVKRDPKGVLDHSSRVFLVDQRGRQREIYNLEFLNEASVLADVRELLAEAARKPS
jgi:protein SCO1